MKKKVDYKNMSQVTAEDVREWKKALSEAAVKSRLTTFNLPQGHIGNGVYRIADGCLTNKSGWDDFQKELLRRWNETINKTEK